MSLALHNSLTQRKEIFVPQDPARVTMYACGPTVYNYAHIGNARPAVVFDLLFRLLRRRWPNVCYARNITDVDDKINAAASAQGVPIEQITERFIQAYREDMQALGALPPSLEPRATDHISHIQSMCERLLATGHAYVAAEHVLFSVQDFADYGQLSKRSLDDMISGARIEVAPYKRHPGDFVLWKPSTPDLPGWDSPWGRGRPGWHIECSAMCAAHLGETIDIHAGGNDLIFPHHENEIAQSTCAHGGRTFARYWLHNGFVTIDKRKMSKSLGNVLLVRELRQRARPEALRLLLLSAHYRQPLDWSDSAMDQASRTLDRLYGTLRELADVERISADPPEDFIAALEDDINTPKALSLLPALARNAVRASDPEARRIAKAQLLAAGELLGLLQADPEQWFATALAGADALDERLIERLIEDRQAARTARDFARADQIRAELSALGVSIEDGAEGTRWRVDHG